MSLRRAKHFSVHVRVTDIVLRKSAISSLAFKIAKMSRHHLPVYEQWRSFESPIPLFLSFSFSLSAREHARRILVASALLSART
jgi:hypothetical protein